MVFNSYYWYLEVCVDVLTVLLISNIDISEAPTKRVCYTKILSFEISLRYLLEDIILFQQTIMVGEISIVGVSEIG